MKMLQPDSQWLLLIQNAAYILMHPSYWFGNQFLSCFFPTTLEQKLNPLWTILSRLCLSVVYVAGLLISLPLGFIGYMMRHIVQCFRRQFIYVTDTKSSQMKFDKSEWSFASANLCLMPEFLARFNNLSHNALRAKKIGDSIVKQQRIETLKHHRINGFVNNGHGDTSSNSNQENFGPKMEFPILDILCLQELLDRRCMDILVNILKSEFPYILYDARTENTFLVNSGLCIASRYPIIDAQFHIFPDKKLPCSLACKGVLVCKVLVSENDRGETQVGYIANTHFQSFQGKDLIHQKQLSCMLKWVTDFKLKTFQDQNEKIVFDVITGDLNLDNTSPNDVADFNHPLFDEYIDVPRIKPGVDHDWSVGTERRLHLLWNDEIKTPERMKQVLNDPLRRQYYVNDADLAELDVDYGYRNTSLDENGEVIPKAVGGKRRVDYVLYHNGTNQKATAYNVVTQLCQWTDHLCISLTLKND